MLCFCLYKVKPVTVEEAEGLVPYPEIARYYENDILFGGFRMDFIAALIAAVV